MARRGRHAASRSLFIFLALFVALAAGWAKTTSERDDKIRNGWKDITETALMDTVRELCAENYAGRLTGTKGYDEAAEWLAARLAGWGLAAGGGQRHLLPGIPRPLYLGTSRGGISLLPPAGDG